MHLVENCNEQNRKVFRTCARTKDKQRMETYLHHPTLWVFCIVCRIRIPTLSTCKMVGKDRKGQHDPLFLAASYYCRVRPSGF
jgi:hypothetical protein